jgi:hypothetical protein
MNENGKHRSGYSNTRPADVRACEKTIIRGETHREDKQNVITHLTVHMDIRRNDQIKPTVHLYKPGSTLLEGGGTEDHRQRKQYIKILKINIKTSLNRSR